MMKKYWLLMMLAGCFLTACGENTVQTEAAPVALEGAAPEGKQEDDAFTGTYWTDEDLPVSMRTEQDAYRPDAADIRTVITNRTDAEYSYEAEQFSLYRLVNGEEQEVPYRDNGDYFIALASVCMPQSDAQFTANLAEHYDLPLEEGAYVLHVGELRAGFVIAADADEQQEQEAPDAQLAMEIRQADAGALTVLLQNNGDAPFDFTHSEFGLEHHMGESVSYTPYSGAAAETTVPPHESLTVTLQTDDLGGTLESGHYALLLRNQKAEFEIT